MILPSYSDKYELPWWWVEPNESLLEWLKRELMEEIWLTIKNISENPFFTYDSYFCYIDKNNNKDFCHSLCLFFKCEIDEKITDIIDSDIQKTEWMEIDTITENNFLYHHFQAIEKHKQFYNNLP